MASTKDKFGRQYALVAKTKAGDKIEADGDFTCIPAGAVLAVEEVNGCLCVPCEIGRHALHEHEQNGCYLGFYEVQS